MPLIVRIIAVLCLVAASVESLTVPKLCKSRNIGYKIQDPEDCHSFYVCLGSWGEFNGNCAAGYRFNETQQKCIKGKCPPCPCLKDYNDNSVETTGYIPAMPVVFLPNTSNNTQPAVGVLSEAALKEIYLKFNNESLVTTFNIISLAISPSSPLNNSSNSVDLLSGYSGSSQYLLDDLNATNALKLNNTILNSTQSFEKKVVNNTTRLLPGRVTNFDNYTLTALMMGNFNQQLLFTADTAAIESKPPQTDIATTEFTTESVSETTTEAPTTVTEMATTDLTLETTNPTESSPASTTESTSEILPTATPEVAESTTFSTIETTTVVSTVYTTESGADSTITFTTETPQYFSELPTTVLSNSATESPNETTTQLTESSTEITTEVITSTTQTIESSNETTVETTTPPEIKTTTETSQNTSTLASTTTKEEPDETTTQTTESPTDTTTSSAIETSTPSISITSTPESVTLLPTTVSSAATTESPVETTTQTTESSTDTTTETTTSSAIEASTQSITNSSTPKSSTTTISSGSNTESPTDPTTQTTDSPINTTRETTTSSATDTSTQSVTNSSTPDWSTVEPSPSTTELPAKPITPMPESSTESTTTKATPTTTRSTLAPTTTTRSYTSIKTTTCATAANHIMQQSNNEYADLTSICANRKDGYFVKDPRQCNKYYTCFVQQAYPQLCPGQLLFDDKLKMCNYPDLVDCQPYTKIMPAFTPKRKSKKPITTVTRESMDKKVTTKTPTNNSKLNLKPEDCSYLQSGTFVQDHKNCNKYYVCLNGYAIALYCPRGQYFDIEALVCNFKSMVKNCPC